MPLVSLIATDALTRKLWKTIKSLKQSPMLRFIIIPSGKTSVIFITLINSHLSFIYILGIVKRNLLFFHSISCKNNIYVCVCVCVFISLSKKYELSIFHIGNEEITSDKYFKKWIIKYDTYYLFIFLFKFYSMFFVRRTLKLKYWYNSYSRNKHVFCRRAEYTIPPKIATSYKS